MFRSADMHNWYAWDGTSFSVPMNNPNAYTKPPASYTCKAVLSYPQPYGDSFGSLDYIPAKKLFLGVGGYTNNVFYLTSSDLVHWSETGYLFPPGIIVRTNAWEPGLPEPQNYLDLVDPDSQSLNFDTLEASDSMYVYSIRLLVTTNTPTGVQVVSNYERDVIRYPVTMTFVSTTTP